MSSSEAPARTAHTEGMEDGAAPNRNELVLIQ